MNAEDGCSHKPRGSKDPNHKVLGAKYYSVHGSWALKPYRLGPWILREREYGARHLFRTLDHQDSFNLGCSEQAQFPG